MHNKSEYWKNRKSGKRGQGELPVASKPKFLVNKNTGKWIGKKRPQAERDEGIEIDEWDRGKNMVRTRNGFDMINRKQHRMKQRDTDENGRPYTAKGVKPNKQRKEKFSLHLDPTLSNKQRHHLRRQRREMILEDQRKEKQNEEIQA